MSSCWFFNIFQAWFSNRRLQLVAGRPPNWTWQQHQVNLSEFQIVFVLVPNWICPKSKLYMSKYQIVFDQAPDYICLYCKENLKTTSETFPLANIFVVNKSPFSYEILVVSEFPFSYCCRYFSFCFGDKSSSKFAAFVQQGEF